MTAAEALRRATAALRGGGIPEAARDARLLLAHSAGWAADRVGLNLDEVLTEDQSNALGRAIAARLARQPVAQILGRRLFWGRPFRVTRAVLDPRPETESLVAEALKEPFARVLDLGTGSGAILLTLLAERPGARGLGVDLSEEALAVAAQTASDLGLAARCELRRSDWLAAVDGAFDLIVSNPPYIAEAEWVTLLPEVRAWEPRLALTPGGDGLDAYRRIAAGVGAHLAPGGRLLLEIGPTQAAAVAGLLVRAGLHDIAVQPDLDGRDRVVTARRPAS